jgi:urease beta subunit
MAGIHFSFINFKQVLALNIGMADRLDSHRSENFTLLYCNFEGIKKEIVDDLLKTALRASDSIINHESDYFFIFPFTDKYGADIVKKIFVDTSLHNLQSFILAYPADGKNPEELLHSLQKNVHEIQLELVYHQYFEVNKALEFSRRKSYGFHLNIPAGTSIRFEPGDSKKVELTEFSGKRIVYGFSGLVNGSLTEKKDEAFSKAKDQGFRGMEL